MWRDVLFGLALALVTWSASVAAGVPGPLSTDQKAFVSSLGVQRPALRYDRAWLTLNLSTPFPVHVWTQSTQCWKCPLVYVTEAAERNTTTVTVNTTAETRLALRRTHPGGFDEEFCSFSVKFAEFGDYWLFVDFGKALRPVNCSFAITNSPEVAELPILYVGLGLMGLAILSSVVFSLYRCLRKSKNLKLSRERTGNGFDNNAFAMEGGDEESGHSPVAAVAVKKPRLHSLDAFRGLSLTVMIFVNYGGGGYWFFQHPPWDGLTVADLVFPWFMFIMGTSMTFSFRSMYRRRMSAGAIVWKIVFRAAKLFALGIVLNSSWGPTDMSRMRIPGVLQRFALTYLVVALIHLIFYRKEDSHQESCWAPVRDVVLYLWEWMIHLGVLSAHLALTYALPVPGCPTGYTGPGGISEGGRHERCTGGAARYIDVMVLGDSHIYQYPTPKVLYQTPVAYDPEGILGTLTSIFLCFLGLQAGKILAVYPGTRSRVVRWVVWGVITGVAAAVLCKGSQHDGWIPVNKNLWSVSFILVTASFAFLLLTAFYIFIDVLKWWGGQPFTFPGMNSIVVYFCHDIFWRCLPYNWELEPLHWKILLQDVWGTAFWVIVAYVLYRKKIFVAL